MADKAANELWIQIIKYLPRTDLPNISRTCKLLNKLAEPYLYSILDTTSHKSGPDKSIALFFRTILDKPELALHVRHVTLQGKAKAIENGMWFESGNLDVCFLAPEHFSMLQQYIPRSMLDSYVCDNWIGTIYKTANWDAVAGFILLSMLCPLSRVIVFLYLGSGAWSCSKSCKRTRSVCCVVSAF